MSMLKALIASLFLSLTSVQAAIVIREVDPLIKVLPGATLPQSFSTEQAVALNDHVQFQLVLRSTKDEQVRLRLSSSSLSSSILSQVKIYRVGFIKVTDHVWTHGDDKITAPDNVFPDPLFPVSSFTLVRNKVQPLVLDVSVDSKFPVGRHKISAEVLSGNKIVARVTLPFYVHNVLLPESQLGYVNWFHDVDFGLMNNGQKVENFSLIYWDIFKKMVQEAKDLGQSSFAVNAMFLTKFLQRNKKVSFDFTNLNKALDIILNEVKLRNVIVRQFGIRMEGWESAFGLQTPFFYGEDAYMMKNYRWKDREVQEFYPSFLRAYYNNLVEKNFLSRVLQHVADEPIESNAESYIELVKQVRKYAPGLTIMEATISAKTFPFIDIIVVPLGEIPRLKADLDALQKEGKKDIWFYTSMHPQGNWANRFIEQPLMKTQILPWIASKYGYAGYLHWALNFWAADPYKDASFEPYNLPGGDSFLVYPGIGTINPSLRAFAMRNGIKDAAIVELLKTRNPGAARQIIDEMVQDYSIYNTSTTHYYLHKRRMLLLLESN